MVVIENISTCSAAAGSSAQSPQKMIHLIIPPSAKWDKTFLLQTTCLSTLCSLFLLTLLSGLYSGACSVNIICHSGADGLKSRPFLLSCRWLMQLRQAAATIPLPSLTSLHHQHLVSTNKLHLSPHCILVNQSRRFFHLTRYFGITLLFNICKQCITN